MEAHLKELKRFEQFQGFGDNVVRYLCEGGRVTFNQHRDVLFHFEEQAHYFGIVLSGAYKLCRPSLGGSDSIVQVVLPGDIVGALIMCNPKPIYPVSVVSMGPSRFLKIPKDVYPTAWQMNAAVASRVQELLGRRMQQMHMHKVLMRSHLSVRLAQLLLDLMDQVSTEGVHKLKVPVTRQEMADVLGVTVESVIRTMSPWSKEGVIQTTEQYIQILRVDVLVKITLGAT
ncbi:Crp/Fnr family transcriptional regulator [Bdellovibrio bacteriovorus]|uniref:Crp/Fnr family transcriptional regulator n=1 Tax=Bdellovibrio bacteriovorus TaxID=959 RepID=UPI0035A710D0